MTNKEHKAIVREELFDLTLPEILERLVDETIAKNWKYVEFASGYICDTYSRGNDYEG